MAETEAVTTKPGRKNVSKACVACRETKTKCDGVLPTCGNCARKDKLCQYAEREDKRRVALRPTLEVLQRRVAQLDAELVKFGLAPPPMDEADEQLVNRALETVGLPQLPPAVSHVRQQSTPESARTVPSVSMSDPLVMSSTSVDMEPVLPMQSALQQPTMEDDVASMSFDDVYQFNWDEIVSPDWPWMAFFPDDAGNVPLQGPTAPVSQAAPRLQGGTASVVPTALPNPPDSSQDDEVDQELVTQIAARFGSLHVAPDGKLRYFGTPTNIHLFSNKNVGPYSNPRSMKLDGTRLLRNADIAQNIDRELEEHLIELYFSWHNSCNPVVSESMYLEARRLWDEGLDDNGFYSEVLTNAMCAIGASYEARYHPKLVTFPRPLSEFFAERAKILLEIELDSPCVTTVQALLLLSSHEIGFQRTARSWLYGGMAMRICFDLGLHIDVDSYVERGAISAQEAQARQTAFWASYVLNYRASFSLGRPFTLDASEITVRKPSATSRSLVNPGRAYPPSNGHLTYTQSPSRRSRDVMHLADMISEQRITLCDLVEPIARALYGNTEISLMALLEMSQGATAAMFKWKEGLPKELVIDDSQTTVSPQLLILHLEYYYLQILVHRPWTSRRQNDAQVGRGFRHARQICVASACEMANIVAIFERRFGCRRMDVESSQMLPSAALILIFAAISVQGAAEKDTEILAHLNTFFRTLDELSNVHISARVHLDGLLYIQERWHRIYGPKREKKRDGSSQHSSEMATSSKRTRL